MKMRFGVRKKIGFKKIRIKASIIVFRVSSFNKSPKRNFGKQIKIKISFFLLTLKLFICNYTLKKTSDKST